MNGKGSRPRNNYGREYRTRYDDIDWDNVDISKAVKRSRRATVAESANPNIAIADSMMAAMGFKRVK